jgi:uncharacterized protein (TIGR03435 family)
MTSVLIASSIRIVLVALFAALLVRAFRIRHPATLHGLWFAVAAVMLVMPVIVQYSPRLTLPVLPPPSVMRPLLAGDATEPIAADRAAAVQGEPSATPSALPDVLTLVYLAGVVIFAARVAAGLAAVRRLRRTVTMEEGQFTHEACAAPITIGLIRPVTVLPRGWSAWPAARREAVLTHERAHVRRRDPLLHLIAVANRIVFWFHPLAWWLERRVAALAEHACDEAVLERGSSPSEYAELLIEMARCVTRTGHRVGAPGIASPASGLTGRITAILDDHRAASPSFVRRLAFAAAVIVGAGVLSTAIMGQAGAARLDAQNASAGRRFDVVSVKRNTSGAQGGTSQFTPGRYAATNISLRILIRDAYGMLDRQIVDGPPLATAEYARADKFDIVATFSGEPTAADRRAMMQAMLADRFKVVVHTERREMPVYALMRARSDGSLADGMTLNTDPACAAAERARGAAPPPQGDGPRCGALQFAPGHFIARAVGVDMLVNSLANRPVLTGIDRPVLDRTDLSGRYDFTLRWTPPGRGGGPGDADSDQPAIVTALREQLGLKLEAQRTALDVLVIDSADMPTEN